MKPIINYTRWISLVTCLLIAHLVLQGQDPCDPTECCLDNEGFEDYAVGVLPPLPFQASGFFPFSGTVNVVSDGHLDANSVEYVVGTGSALAYDGGSGVGGPTPAMEMGKDYCIEFCVFVNGDNGPVSVAVSTGSNVIFASNYSFTGSWVTVSVPTYTAVADHQTIFFNINGTLETPIRFDNICIEEEGSGAGGCMAEFELDTVDECGEYCFNNLSCGEALTYDWSIRNGINVEVASGTTEDFCFDFQVSDIYTVVLNIVGADGCTDEFVLELPVDVINDPFTVDCTFGETIMVQGGADCTHDYTIPNLNWSGGVGMPSITVLLDGNTYVEGDQVTLSAGTYNVVYLVTAPCGVETQCVFILTIECEDEVLPEQCGWMVMTCVGSMDDPIVGGLYDTRFNSNAPAGEDWNNNVLGAGRINKINPAMWNINDIGQVFGIALDDQNGMVYLAATDIYEYDDIWNYFNGTAVGTGGTAGIYSTDFINNVNVTNTITSTVNSAGGNVIGTTTIPNTGGVGNGIGNIAFDERHNQLYATNLEDGRIYRISPSGVILSVFDPFVLDSGISTGMAVFGEQLWAVGVYDDGANSTVYFSRQMNGSSEIWSIQIDATGEFVATQSSPGIFDDTGNSSKLEITNIINAEGRVTDIAFSHSGRMLLAERGHPHKTNTYEYVNIGGTWTMGNDFYTGPAAGTNTAGGVDYGARESNEVVNDMCDDIVWSSMNYARPLQVNNYVYGAQGMDASGNASVEATRNANDLYIDANGIYGVQDKSGIGDLELFNCGCLPADSNCDSLMVMSEPIPNVCFDQSIITGNPCSTQFDPVCGCDGNTYSNECVANEAGVTTVASGECNGNNTPEVSDLCCYSIDIKNNYGPNIVELEVEMITPEWIFNTTTLAAPFTFGSCGSLNHKFSVADATSGFIPSGLSMDAIATCFAPVVNNPTTQPIVEFKWKELVGDEELLTTCRDTLDFFCELPPPIDTCLVIASDTIRCIGEDNPLAYEYCFTLTNKSGQDVSQIVIDDLTTGFTFFPLGTNSTIVFPTPSPLPDQATSNQICVQVQSSIPITAPQSFCMKMGLVAADGSDCCHSPVEICKDIEPCCDPCDDKSVTFNSIGQNDDECCYSVDITNECAMPYFTKIEAVVNTPGVCFGSHVIGAAHTGNWLVSSTPQSICMEPFGGIIDQPSYQDLFSFCLDKIDDPLQANPSVTIRWYAADPITGAAIVVCEDTLETECPSADNDCVIISDGDLICVPDSNKYRYTFKVKNVSNPGFTADRLHLLNKTDPAWQPVPSGPVIVLSPPLAPGDSTIITTCIAGPAFPAPFSDFVFGYRLQNVSDGDCCFESVCDTIPVPTCMDCCDEDRLDMELDNYLSTLLVNNCKVSFGPVELDTCVALTINWGDGTGDAYDMDSTACKVYDQSGAYNVCVQFEVFPDMGIFPCYQKDTCLTVEIVDCPSDCFSVVDIEAKEVVCDTTDCYESPFCQPWLVDEIAGISCPTFFQPYVQKANYLGATVFLFYYPNFEGASIEIYDCGGTLLQSCTPTGGGGQSCNPYAGIDINTDLSNLQLVWMCGDPLPTLDPSCASTMSVEYCVKVMNQSANDADKVTLNPILPAGATITPSVINGNIPSGGMSTLTFTVNGPLVPGMDTKIDAQLMGVTANGEEWMCNDTICLPTPTCPLVDDCCQDEMAFDALVSQGLQITDLGDCTYQVCANQFEDCHWFWTVGPDWGDGTIVLPTLTQSDSPNNCWTHTYTTSGVYSITLNVEEQNADGEACWNGQMQSTVEPNCDLPPLPFCNECPDGTTAGPNLIVNGDFTAGNVGFTSGLTYLATGTLASDVNYSIRNSTNLANGFWAATDHTANDPAGNYLIVDATDGSLLWEQNIAVTVGNNYMFCAAFDNLVNPASLTENTPLRISVLINGIALSTINNVAIPQLPDLWAELSDTWTATTNNANIQIIMNAQGQYGDLAIDDISFASCGVVVDDCCDIITPGDIDGDNTDALNSITIMDCEVCLDIDHEECVEWTLDWGDGNVEPASTTDINQLCHDYTISGNYTITITGRVYDDQGMICHEVINTETVTTDCGAVDDCCDTVTPADIDASLTTSLNNITTDDCEACIDISLGNCVEWTIDWGDGATAGPSNGVSQLCHDYTISGTYTITANGKVYDDNGLLCHDVTVSEQVSVDCEVDEDCCDDYTQPLLDFDVNLAITNIAIDDCEVCFTGEFPDCVNWYVNWGDGATPIGTSMGSDTRCLDYDLPGTYTACLIAFVLDSEGDTCLMTEQCIDVMPDCEIDEDCCDDYTQPLLDFDVNLAITNIAIDDCEVCVTGEFPDCVNWYVNWGDGDTPIGTSMGSDTRCLDYDFPGTYTACLIAFVLDSEGDTCLMTEQCIDVMPDCDTNCCDISEEEYDDLFADLLDYDMEGCDTICFYPDGEFCDLITIDFGDGNSVGPISADDDICNVYTSDGVYNVCVTLYRLDDDDPSINCIERDTCFDVVIDCGDGTDCCGNYTQMDLEQDVALAIASLDSMDCNYCIDLDFPDCVQWGVNWGDGTPAPGASGSDILCHDYTIDGPITMYVSAGVSDGVNSLCMFAVDSVSFDVQCDTISTPGPTADDCDPNTWGIPNGLTPNGDGFNEELRFSNTDDCRVNIKVYNRWGQMVYVQNDYTMEWHGQSENGEDLPDGTYYLLIGTDSKRDGSFDNFITRYIDLRRE